jgi:hypothetical protein
VGLQNCLAGATTADFRYEHKKYAVRHASTESEHRSLLRTVCPSFVHPQSDPYKLTALGIAARNGHNDVVVMLVEAGADVDYRTNEVLLHFRSSCARFVVFPAVLSLSITWLELLSRAIAVLQTSNCCDTNQLVLIHIRTPWFPLCV